MARKNSHESVTMSMVINAQPARSIYEDLCLLSIYNKDA